MTMLHDVIARNFLDVSCRRLDQMTECLEVCLRKLSEEQVWQRQGAHENAVGQRLPYDITRSVVQLHDKRRRPAKQANYAYV